MQVYIKDSEKIVKHYEETADLRKKKFLMILSNNLFRVTQTIKAQKNNRLTPTENGYSLRLFF